MLRELSLRVDDADRALIQEALDVYEDDNASNVSIKSMKRRKTLFPGGNEGEGGEDFTFAAAGEQTPMDSEGLAHIEEDLLRSRKSREIGYVGQGAEVQWLRSLQDQAIKTQPEMRSQNAAGIHLRPLAGTTDDSFYLDSDSTELEFEVDMYEIPPIEMAEKLFESYMKTVHRSFPILPPHFEDQFRRYFNAVGSKQRFSVPDRWLAIVNVVFAIGAYHSHLVDAEWRGEERDHLIYMMRAVRLMGSWPFNTAPDLAIIQVTGLLSFYYQVIGHVSRGWVMIGIAIRQALALGLHLRNDDSKVSGTRKETCIRTWWSLHAIECLLSATTGRPCVLGHEDCTVPLPLTLSEESSQSAWISRRVRKESPTPASSSIPGKTLRLQQPRSYLDAHLNIGLITQKLLSSLYSPRISQKPWGYIQSTIPLLLRELETWKQGALPAAEEAHTGVFSSPEVPREMLLLRFYYFSTKILITRPCLCRYGRKMQNQSPSSTDFDQSVADECVEAALGMTNLLPDQPNAPQLYHMGPWWSIVHHSKYLLTAQSLRVLTCIVMQAMAVLLLELSFCEESMRDDDFEVKNTIKKLLRWMRAMQIRDAVVARAYKIVVNILKQGVFRSGAKDLFTDEYSRQEHPEAITGYGSSSRPAFGSHVAETRSEFPVDFGQAVNPQDITNSMINQSPPREEPFQFMEDRFENTNMFANPFMTGFDQGQPFGLNLEDLWSPVDPQRDYSLANDQIFNYPNYTVPPNQDPPDQSQ